MKSFFEFRLRRFFGGIVVAIVTLLVLGSCLKDGDPYSEISAVAALNAVPGSEGLDIGLDRNQLNNKAWGETFAYRDTLPYKNAFPARRLVRVFEPVRNPSTPPLAQVTVDFIPGQFYTLYVVGHEEIELLYTEDDLSAPEEGNAKIRFIHLSPDAPALDLSIEGQDALLASDKVFKKYTGFEHVEANKTYTFNIIDHESGEIIHEFEFKPANKMIYTIWAKGLMNDEDDIVENGFGHAIITH